MKTFRVKDYFYLSILASVVVISLKLWAWRLSNSVGLFSDAIESVANVTTAVFGLWMIHIAETPPDAEHPYGHSKAEYFAGGFEGICILIAAISIWHVSIDSLMEKAPLPEGGIGLFISVLATIVNAGVGLMLVKAGRKLNSIALLADGKHLLTDVWTTVGVLTGVGCAVFFRLPWLDPMIGLAVGAYIGYEALHLLHKAVQGLLDHSLNAEELSKLNQLLEAEKHPEAKVMDLATREAGRVRFVRFKLLVEGSMSVEASHNLCDRLERKIIKDFGPCEVDIHIEPLSKMA